MRDAGQSRKLGRWLGSVISQMDFIKHQFFKALLTNMVQDQAFRDCISSRAKLGSKERAGLMAWFPESLQQCNHWTFQSTWSHSWHVLKEGSNKMPPTRSIKHHTKLLHMQNACHESKPWRLHSADKKLCEVEGHFALSPLMMTSSSRFVSEASYVLLLECASWQGTASSSVTEVIMMAPFIEQVQVPDSTWWCGNGRPAMSRANSLHPTTFVVEQWVQQLLFPHHRLSLKWTPVVILLLFDPYHDLSHLPDRSLLPLNKEMWSYVSS